MSLSSLICQIFTVFLFSELCRCYTIDELFGTKEFSLVDGKGPKPFSRGEFKGMVDPRHNINLIVLNDDNLVNYISDRSRYDHLKKINDNPALSKYYLVGVRKSSIANGGLSALNQDYCDMIDKKDEEHISNLCHGMKNFLFTIGRDDVRNYVFKKGDTSFQDAEMFFDKQFSVEDLETLQIDLKQFTSSYIESFNRPASIKRASST